MFVFVSELYYYSFYQCKSALVMDVLSDNLCYFLFYVLKCLSHFQMISTIILAKHFHPKPACLSWPQWPHGDTWRWKYESRREDVHSLYYMKAKNKCTNTEHYGLLKPNTESKYDLAGEELSNMARKSLGKRTEWKRWSGHFLWLESNRKPQSI